MIKFWKILNNSDIKLSLEYLKVDKQYIDIILDDDSSFQSYLKENFKYVCISYDDDWISFGSKFGWFEGDDDSISHMLSKGCVFAGNVTLRKQKLKKLENIVY